MIKYYFLKVNQTVSNAFKTHVFITPLNNSDCRAHFDLNTDYLVIADIVKEANPLYLSLCSNVRKWDTMTTDQKEIINTYKTYPKNFVVKKHKKIIVSIY